MPDLSGTEPRPALCRICPSYCPILVTVEEGRPVKVTGDPAAPLYEGYTCPKGRALPEFHTAASRLLTSMKRGENGQFAPIASETAMDEIAARVSDIIARHGPRAVALYVGTGIVPFFENMNVAFAWMEAIGSPMAFTASAIDKPGAPVAQALHGHWRAGHPPFEAAEAWILIGLNPLISKSGGFPPNNPAKRLKDAVVKRGLKLIVIDPRATESAERAHLHLQARPGQDPAILAAMIHVILAERLYDADFVSRNVDGFEALRQAVESFTPSMVAQSAGVRADDIVEAARIFATSRYAGIGCGVGPSFSLVGTLTDYLSLSLMTLCGFWSRDGDTVTKPNILLPPYEPRAEAQPPFRAWGFGEQLRIRGLGNSVGGLPTGALADEILTEGEGQVRALFCLGGNPMMAWPDQHRAFAALKSLDLLVTSDPEMSATARLSHYVIAPRLTLETPASSVSLESIKYMGHLRGIEGPYARYAPAIVAPADGADVITDWELYYGLARRMGLQLTMTSVFGMGEHREAPTERHTLDMVNQPSDDDLVELGCRQARIPLAEVKKWPHGRLFEEVREKVLPKASACAARLDIGNPDMLGDLARRFGPGSTRDDQPGAFTLLSRRTNRLMNSCGRMNEKLGGLEETNPVFLHPDDMVRLGVAAGDRILISNANGQVIGIARPDAGLRPGHASVTHGFGGNPGDPEVPERDGCNVGRLLSASAEFDPVTGIPRISGVTVHIASVIE